MSLAEPLNMTGQMMISVLVANLTVLDRLRDINLRDNIFRDSNTSDSAQVLLIRGIQYEI